MRKSRLIFVPLAATLIATAFAGPAAASGTPTWPAQPKPVTPYRGNVDATDRGFDWGSAGVGAGAGIAVLVAGAAGMAGIRRRRVRAHPVRTS